MKKSMITKIERLLSLQFGEQVNATMRDIVAQPLEKAADKNGQKQFPFRFLQILH